jgi:hypothetical protein
MRSDHSTHMNFSRLLLISAVTSFAFFGCNRPSKAPTTGFRLTVQDVATDTNARAALLIIHTTSAGSISIDQDGGHNSTMLSEPNAGGSREGSVALIASRIAPPGDGEIFIQTLIRPQTPNGNYAGGPSTYTLPRTTELTDHFTITAKSGDFALNTPIEIARLKGKPVTLTVGKPTK